MVVARSLGRASRSPSFSLRAHHSFLKNAPFLSRGVRAVCVLRRWQQRLRQMQLEGLRCQECSFDPIKKILRSVHLLERWPRYLLMFPRLGLRLVLVDLELKQLQR